ncbi:hypothetical protein KHA80_18700 [Anaerobacillus sp. HL2]|nr:hypothetical protein KHA80_18700 [Anaerobacillus sp. HL2]
MFGHLPWMLIIGIIASGFVHGFTVNGIANGIIAAGASITTHQAYKQTINRNIEEDRKITLEIEEIDEDQSNQAHEMENEDNKK